jgi:membrane protein DedA with SNARE-associated domain
MKAGRTVLSRPGPLLGLRLGALARGDRVFARWAVVAVFLTPSWIAGIHRVRPVVFLLSNAAAAAVWAVGIGLGAYFIGPAIVDVAADLGWVTLIAVVVLVVGIVGAELVRRHRAAREGTSRG